MGKKLVIVESPAKAKTINKILGKDYIVKSSVGHIRDLPLSSLGVDVENDFSPQYVVVKGKQKVIAELKQAAKECDSIYLAPDPDREGEAIAWHLQQVLSPAPDKEFHRIRYNEITPTAVREAFNRPGEIDQHLVDAQQARRILDRIVGYKVSPMLWRRIRRGLSAGRVQSVALRLLCEREEKVTAFVPEEYWVIGAQVRKVVIPLDPFTVMLSRVDGEKVDIKTEKQASAARQDLEGRQLRVAEVATKEVKRRAPPPFITSTLQQAASTQCGFSPSRTMSTAQRLYEGVNLGSGPVGLITYMRTDSLNISRDAQDACRKLITSEFGPEFYPESPNVYKSRQSAQEAHEAIRPTDVNRSPDSLSKALGGPELRLYRLIWQRFVASQMVPARIEQRTIKIEAVPDEQRKTEYLFQANDSEVKFPGFMRVLGDPDKDDPDKKEDGGREQIPGLTEGEPLIALEWLCDRKETQPPPRYTETSLIGTLESNGIGRPSTYAQIIQTLQDRTYVNRERRTLFPTDLGMQVSALLVETLGELFNVAFTASMEEALDNVERGLADWTSMLGDFYGRFQEWMEGTQLPPADTEAVQRSLALFSQVTEWAPEVKRGKRTYSDESFVQSVAKQLEDGKKPITQRQLETLLKIACRYRKQIPEVTDVVTELGQAELLDRPDSRPAKASTMRKFEILAQVDLDERTREFIESLKQRADGGRGLTEAQLGALDRVLVSHSRQIEGFDLMKEELELSETKPEEDNESGPLLAALSQVKEWKPPVKRGNREFNDESFFASLSKQYENRGALSIRQRAAMKRMLSRYREQIPDFEQLSQKFELGKSKGRRPRSRGRSSKQE